MPNVVFSEMSGNDIPLDHDLQTRKYLMTHNFETTHENLKNHIVCACVYYSFGINVDLVCMVFACLVTLCIFFVIFFFFTEKQSDFITK